MIIIRSLLIIEYMYVDEFMLGFTVGGPKTYNVRYPCQLYRKFPIFDTPKGMFPFY